MLRNPSDPAPRSDTKEYEQYREDLKQQEQAANDPEQLSQLWHAVRTKNKNAFKQALSRVQGIYAVSLQGYRHEDVLLAAVSYEVVTTGHLRYLARYENKQYYNETLLSNLDLWAKRFLDEMKERNINLETAHYAGLRPCMLPKLWGFPKAIKDQSMEGILIPQPRLLKGEKDHYRRYTTEKQKKTRWTHCPDCDPLYNQPTGLWRYRFFDPLKDTGKYRQPGGTPTCIYSVGDYKHNPHPVYEKASYVVVVEGLLAAVKLVSDGIAAVALGGYNMWHTKGGKGNKDCRRLINWAKDSGKRLIVCFDANFDDNDSIELHANAFATFAAQHEVDCRIARLPLNESQPKGGPDDIDKLELIAILQKAEQPEPTFLPSNTVDPNDERPIVLHGRGVEMVETAKQLAELTTKSERFYRKDNLVGEVLFSTTFNRHEFRPLQAKEWPSRWQEFSQLASKPKDPEDTPDIFNMSTQFADQVACSQQFIEPHPELLLISNAPVLLSDGSQVVGYKDGILAFGGSEVASIDIKEARGRLISLLEEYAPANPEDLSRMLAKVIDPALVFGGFFGDNKATTTIIQANAPQAGKDLFVAMVAAIYNHKVVPIPPSQKSHGGPVLMMNAALVRDDPFISFSNWRNKMDEPDIESVQSTTCHIHPARILNHNPINVDVRRRIFFITSNGMRYTPDQIERGCAINILKQKGRVFKRSLPPSDWRYYLEAIYTVILDWIDRGKPEEDTTAFSYTHWWRVLKEIVAHNWPELPPIDHKHIGLLDAASGEDIAFLRDLINQVPHDSYDKPLFVRDLLEAANLPADFSDCGVASRKLSRCFSGQSMKVFGELVIKCDTRTDAKSRTVTVFIVSKYKPMPEHLSNSSAEF